MKALIAFEGIEGCGKTTQIRMAGEYLENQKIPHIITEEPGGSPLGKKIREILLNQGPYLIGAKAELLLFSAARAQHVEEVIQPALRAGKLVLCDRFSDATLAYQGFGRALDIDFIKTLDDFSSPSLKPDRTLLFDLPVETGLTRARDRIARIKDLPREDRFENEETAFHRRIREGYLLLAREEPERFRVIDSSRDIAAIHRDVRQHLSSLIRR
jgi:dTMP kinase